MTPDVAAFLLDMLSRHTLGATDSDLREVADLCVRAREQLQAAL